MAEKFGERLYLMRPTLVSRMVEDRTGSRLEIDYCRVGSNRFDSKSLTPS